MASIQSNRSQAEAAPIDSIGNLMNDVMLAAFDVKKLGGLLDTLSGTGFKSALAAKDDWQEQWWSQATYLAGALEQLAAELKTNGEAIETALHEIRRGRATL